MIVTSIKSVWTNKSDKMLWYRENVAGRLVCDAGKEITEQPRVTPVGRLAKKITTLTRFKLHMPK
jgi:hypothetical protein